MGCAGLTCWACCMGGHTRDLCMRAKDRGGGTNVVYISFLNEGKQTDTYIYFILFLLFGSYKLSKHTC
jgi:hypothetical protein